MSLAPKHYNFSIFLIDSAMLYASIGMSAQLCINICAISNLCTNKLAATIHHVASVLGNLLCIFCTFPLLYKNWNSTKEKTETEGMDGILSTRQSQSIICYILKI